MNKIIIISGPTASGKTTTAIELASEMKRIGWNVEVINFDSLLFYKELVIGTAKPSKEEMDGIPHHLVNICSLKDSFNASEFVHRARPLIAQLHGRNTIPLLVGGSGFYLRSLFKGMYPGGIDKKVKEKVNGLYKKDGILPILELLKKHDPCSLASLHPNDHYRLTRALEYFLSTGETISKSKKEKEQYSPYDLEKTTLPCEILHIHLDLPKEEHLKIIEKRTNFMIADGLIEEVETLLKKYSGKESPFASVGYKQVLALLKGNLTHRELKEKIVVATRQLAKAQRTFFKKIPNKKHYRRDDKNIQSNLLDFLNCPQKIYFS